MGEDIVQIVNKNDELIGHCNRLERPAGAIYRVSALWIENSEYEVLLAQRGLTKKMHPGVWSTAVAGTVDKGETYEENILKETEEEIGITLTIDDIVPIYKRFNDIPGNEYFSTHYLYLTDRDISEFTKEEGEVEALKWMPYDELEQDVREHPERYTPGFYDRVLKCHEFRLTYDK